MRAADHTDLIPVTKAEFAAEITPCLALTSAVSMGEEDKLTWLRAAFVALEGIPIGLLKRGCQAAMRRADHPSKIIPAVMAEIGESWDWRKMHRARSLPQAVPVLTAVEQVTGDEARELCKQFAVGRYAAADAPEAKAVPVQWSMIGPLAPNQYRVPNKGDFEKLFKIKPKVEVPAPEADATPEDLDARFSEMVERA